jgi:hypothetical protein
MSTSNTKGGCIDFRSTLGEQKRSALQQLEGRSPFR